MNSAIKIKNFVITAILFFMLISMNNVYATSVSAQPIEIYETTINDINLTVNNLFGDVITDLITTIEEFEIIGITEFSGWDYETYNNTIHWFDGTIEGNVFAALFQFTAEAPLVEEDTEVSFTIKTDKGDYTTSIIILNDETPPELYNSSIEEEMMSKPIVLPVYVTVEDEETGVKEVNLNYQICGVLTTQTNETNTTTNTTTNETEPIFNVELINIGSLYSGNMNLTFYNNGDCVCFNFEAKNNALEVAELDGEIAIDEMPPIINLTNEDVTYKFNQETAENTVVFFDLEDNENACGFEGTFDCSMILEEEIYGEDEYNTGEMLTMQANISELDDGEYISKIMCIDMAQNQGYSEDFTMIVDTTPPEMYVISPQEPIVVEYNSSNNIIFGFYDEFSGLAEISYSGNFGIFEEPISGYPNKYNMTFNNTLLEAGFNEINFVVEDGVENVLETTYEVCADALAPLVELLNIPEEIGNESNTTQEYYTTFASNSIFEFAVDDDCGYLTCELYINGEATGTILNNAILGNNTINTTLSPGEYNWSMVCHDLFGNTAESSEEIVVVLDDLVPEIEFDMGVNYFIGDQVNVKTHVTDDSEIISVIAEITGQDYLETFELTHTGGIVWMNEWNTNNLNVGDYIIKITAEDEFGNMGIGTKNIELKKHSSSGGSGGSSGGSSGGIVYQSEESEEEPEELVEEEVFEEEIIEEEPIEETTSNSDEMDIGNIGVGKATGFLGGNFGSLIWVVLAILLVGGIVWYLVKTKGNLKKNDIGLEKYLNSRS